MGSNAVKFAKHLETFTDFIQQNRQNLTPQKFSKKFIKLQNSISNRQEQDLFFLESDKLAQTFVEQKEGDIASIIYSTLCRMTEFIPNQLERFAQKGYEVAKTKGDNIHMMARLNNLRKVYYRRPDKLKQYLNVLYNQEACLANITQNYEQTVSGYQSLIRKPATREQYEQMLAHVQTEIAKLTKRKHPQEALEKLLSAREIFQQRGNNQSVSYIDMLIKETECLLSENNILRQRYIS